MAHHMLREHPLIISLLAVAAALIVHFWPKSRVLAEAGGKFKDTGGFYVGAALPEADRGAFPAGFEEASRQLNARFRLFPFTQKWGPNSLANFPEDAMREARLRGAVPLITWEPWTSTFPELRGDPELGRDRGVCAAILRGVFDDYLERYAEKIRNFGDPVLICFAPRADDPASPWSATGGNTPEKFVQAWIYVVSIFDKMGAANAGWVWSPSSSTELDSRFPGRYYVDWINLPAFNKGKAAGGQWREFADLYKPYRGKILEWKLPVMLNGLWFNRPRRKRRTLDRQRLLGHRAKFSGNPRPRSFWRGAVSRRPVRTFCPRCARASPRRPCASRHPFRSPLLSGGTSRALSPIPRPSPDRPASSC